MRTGPCSSARHGSGTVKAQPELSGAPPPPARGSFTARLPGEGWRTRTLPLTPTLASALTRAKQTTVCFQGLGAHDQYRSRRQRVCPGPGGPAYLGQAVAGAVPAAAVLAELAQSDHAGRTLRKATRVIGLDDCRDQGVEVLLGGQVCGHRS